MDKTISIAFIVFIASMIAVFSCRAQASQIEVGPGANQVRIPLEASISDPIAGAQFSFSYSDGLKYTGYEPSEAVKGGMMTPEVEKDGDTHFGFFSGSNIFSPTGGTLEMGHIVFEYEGDEPQTVSVREIKIVEVVDDSTISRIINPLPVTVSRAGGGVEAQALDTGMASSPTAAAAEQATADPSGVDQGAMTTAAADTVGATTVPSTSGAAQMTQINPQGEAPDMGEEGGGAVPWIITSVFLTIALAVAVILNLRKKPIRPDPQEKRLEHDKPETDGEH